MTAAIPASDRSFDDIISISQQLATISPRRKRRRRFLAGMILRPSRTEAYPGVLAVCFFVTILLVPTSSILESSSNDSKPEFSRRLHSFGGGFQVLAWQSGSSILSSSLYHRRHAPHHLHTSPNSYSFSNKALYKSSTLKRFPSTSSSSSSSLWVSASAPPSSRSSSSTNASESHRDSSLEGETSDAIIVDRGAGQTLLQSFLPRQFLQDDGWKSLPLTREILENLALNYLYVGLNNGVTAISLDVILGVLDKEYDKSSTTKGGTSKNSNGAVIIIDGISFDFAATGDPADEMVAQILSLAAMYHVPYELTLFLLDCCTSIAASTVSGVISGSSRSMSSIALNPAAILSAKEAFAHGEGWNSVTFPKGFALQPKKEDVDEEAGQSVLRRRLPGIWSRFVSPMAQQDRRRKGASAAVAAAAEDNVQISAIRKARLKRNRDEFLQHFNAELSEGTSPSSESSTIVALFPNVMDDEDSTEDYQLEQKRDQLVFFPDSVPDHHLSSWKRLRRGVDKSYGLLKKKGRAGFLAYAFFNFCFYSIGFVWQWRRAAAADPFALSSSSAAISVLNVCCRKFGRVFAYLYVISNLIKLPKIFISALLVPSAESALATVKKRLQVSEAAASIILVAVLAVLWVGIAAIPITTEFVQLKRLVHLDQVVKGYIIQPV